MESNTNKKTKRHVKKSVADQQFMKEPNINHSFIGLVLVGRCTRCGDYMIRVENINRCLSCQPQLLKNNYLY